MEIFILMMKKILGSIRMENGLDLVVHILTKNHINYGQNFYIKSIRGCTLIQ